MSKDTNAPVAQLDLTEEIGHVLSPGDLIRLGRFSTCVWTLHNGWYSYGGNRPCNGWYLVRNEDGLIRPLQLPDVYDIYLIEHLGGSSVEDNL